MIEQEARRLAEMVAANAPTGWESAQASGSEIGYGGGVSAFSTSPVPRRTGPAPADLKAQGSTVLEALQQLRGWHDPSYELSCKPSGDFEMVAASDSFIRLDSHRGFQALLDRDHMPPQPGFRQEAGTAAPAGDPRLAAARFREYLDRRSAFLDEPDTLPQPAAPTAIDEAERRIGYALPADLRALYEIADGDGPLRNGNQLGPLFNGSQWLSLDELVAAHELLREPGWFEWDLCWYWTVSDPHPPETIRRCPMHPAWIPFTDNGDFDYLAVDMSPARNGRPGQVIRVGYPYVEESLYVAESVTALLAHYLSQMEHGNYDDTDGSFLYPFPKLGAPGRFEIGGIHIDGSPAAQEAIISPGAEPVRDLSPLTAAVNLRTLTSAHPVADLAPLRALPVETVRVTLDGGDLTPLEGHRHLASLELGTTGPTSIAPLRSVCGLHGLDLSQADVFDLHVLADLTALRYLKLTARQWTTLLDEAGTPPGLAVAALAEETAQWDDALAWATRVGLDPADSVRITGTFGSGGG